MSYIGNPPVVQASRVITELVATAGQTDIYPLGGYTPGDYLDVEINGAALKSTDYTATDGVKIVLSVAMAAGDDVRVKAYGNFAIANSVQKTGDTMTGPLTLGGLLNTGATGQIKFPASQNASADANTLDDYEEGTWTPTLAAVSGSHGGYGTRTGHYTKVGRLVHVQAYLAIANIGTLSGALRITGLPFQTTAASGSAAYFKGSCRVNPVGGMPTSGNGLLGVYTNQGSSEVNLETGTSTGVQSFNASNASSSDFMFEFTYETAT